MSGPSVAVLGTCRVYDAVKSLHDADQVELVTPFWGFAHSAVEVRQIVDIMRGLTGLPEPDDYKLVNMQHLQPKRNPPAKLLSQADAVVIELSSLKAYQAKGYYTQGNRISEAIGVPVPRLNSLLLQDVDNATDDEKTALEGIDGRMLTQEETEAALLAAIDALAPRPIILANHFVVDKPDVHPALEIRRDLRELCDRIAAARPDQVTRFDPTPDLVSRDYPITDYAHYEKAFIPVVADRLATILGVNSA